MKPKNDELQRLIDMASQSHERLLNVVERLERRFLTEEEIHEPPKDPEPIYRNGKH